MRHIKRKRRGKGYTVRIYKIICAGVLAYLCVPVLAGKLQERWKPDMERIISSALAFVQMGIVLICIIVLTKLIGSALAKLCRLRVGKNYSVCNIEEIDKMEGHTFEYFVADLLRQRGFKNVEVTQGSGDYGIDIIATDRNNRRWGIQCKRYSGSVGWHSVEEAHAGAAFYRCERAAVITQSYFTRQVKEGADKIGVQLLDRDWLMQYV